jgi:hypothetical protein
MLLLLGTTSFDPAIFDAAYHHAAVAAHSKCHSGPTPHHGIVEHSLQQQTHSAFAQHVELLSSISSSRRICVDFDMVGSSLATGLAAEGRGES